MPTRTDKSSPTQFDERNIIELVLPAIFTVIVLFCLMQLAVFMFQAEPTMFSHHTGQSLVISAFAI